MQGDHIGLWSLRDAMATVLLVYDIGSHALPDPIAPPAKT